jgi:N6-adenosine-specific RNA methylase IME4
MTWPFGALKSHFYDVIVVDPPWPYELRSEKGESKSYARHYGAMPLREIYGLRIGELARMPAICLLWSISSMLPEAMAAMRHWGFIYKSELVWRKTTRNGKVRMGTGYRIRTCHEPVLLGVLGNPQHKPFPSLFDGLAREHSRKPDEFYELVERCAPQRWYVDVFSRQSRPLWDCWGYEAGKFDPVVSVSSPSKEVQKLDMGAAA